ncbi:MAG: HalX domain-containing protein [Halobacteriaceae archaeon]
MTETPTVLVVDDETEITALYGEWLSDSYDVRRAYNGEEALEKVDESVAVVLLDRRMPDLSGDEVLTEIRERGLDCRVALVTAVDPDFDILELGFDDYLVKPVSRDDLHETVERLLRRASYDEELQRYFSLASRKATLEAEKPASELEASEEYAELEGELDELGDALTDTFAQLDDEDFRAAFEALDTDG